MIIDLFGDPEKSIKELQQTEDIHTAYNKVHNLDILNKKVSRKSPSRASVLKKIKKST